MYMNAADSSFSQVFSRISSGLILVSLLCGVARGQEIEKEHAAKQAATPNPEKMDVLKQLSTSFEEISQRSGRAVVQIFVRSYVAATGSSNEGELLTAEDSSGSGIIMSPDGYILTNAHVVKGAHSLKVQLNARMENERRAQGDRSLNRPIAGSLVGIDHDSDLAVVKIDKKDLPYLTFGNSDELRQGQVVLALGNPLGLDNSVSMGVVSAVSRQIKPEDAMVYIQTDAPINPGNSGGPLVDTDGHVIGVNTFILTQSGGSEGIGFAIPGNIAREVYQQIKTQGHVHRAQLGIVAETVTPEMAEGLKLEVDHGVIISDVEPNGPAAHGGLQVDDIITGLNGQTITRLRQLEAYTFRTSPGTKVTIQVQRGTEKLDVPVVTEEQSGGELDALADAVDPVKNVVPELGIVGLDINKEVRELMPDLRRPAGVVVAAHRSGAPYSGPPIEVGDVIYAVNRNVVNGVAQLRQYLASIKNGQPLVLLLEREGRLLYVPLQSD
jgi:serine protease Do